MLLSKDYLKNLKYILLTIKRSTFEMDISVSGLPTNAKKNSQKLSYASSESVKPEMDRGS